MLNEDGTTDGEEKRREKRKWRRRKEKEEREDVPYCIVGTCTAAEAAGFFASDFFTSSLLGANEEFAGA